MAIYSEPEGVHIVGSVPFKSTKEVLTNVCGALPGRLHSIPDGEVGKRDTWLVWQAAHLPSEVLPLHVGGTPLPAEREPYTLESISPTQYDDAALSSYAEFVELRQQGVIPNGVRFQVCLPTPLAVVTLLCKPELRAEIEPLYEQRLLQALQRIVKNIPHEDLVIQWDICMEISLLEIERGGLKLEDVHFVREPWFTPYGAGIHERLSRILPCVPSDIPLGFHFCYGDYNHVHWKEPDDLRLLVDWANKIADILAGSHRMEYAHMPVPHNRTDKQYFQPLRDLRLHENTRLYLGLVHANDEQGTRERIETARSVYSHPFGVATECGMGRTDISEIDSILTISKAVTKAKQ